MAEFPRLSTMIQAPTQVDMRTDDGDGLSFTPWKCQEASPLSINRYVPCGKTATRLVVSERGRRLYAMCVGCADHNIRNRGAILIAIHEDMNV